MSMGLVLLIFDQGPNPGPSSDRNYLFANFASSNFTCTVPVVFYLNLVNQLNFVDEYRSSHLRYTAHETCTHQQKSTVSSCLHVFQIYLWKLPVTSSQNMIISPREQRVELCTVVLSIRLLGFCELVSEFGKSAACCPELSGGCRCGCCCCSQHVCT